jgi:hypothetical protein
MSSAASAQQSFWGCNNQNKTHLPLICLVPVSTKSVSNNPVAPSLNSSFATQLSEIPVLSSGPAVAVTYDPTTGVPVVSDNLGPILTERAQTIGKHKLLIGFAWQHFNFTDIDGTNLRNLPLVFSSSTGPTQPTNYTVERSNVNFKLNQYTAVGTFGLTDRVDVSVILPFEEVNIGSQATVSIFSVGPDNSAQGQTPPFQAPHLAGSASGIGDMLINVKGLVWKGERANFAAGMLFRFPTGDALNYLGSGAYGFDPYGVLSFQFGRFSPHGRLGYQANTKTVLIPSDPVQGTGSSVLPGGFQYSLGTDVILLRKPAASATLDLLGNQINNAPLLVQGFTTLSAPGYAPQTPYPPPQPTLNPVTRSYNSEQLALGAKIKPWKDLIVFANVTFQLNNVGLRSSPVPLVGASYTFGK